MRRIPGLQCACGCFIVPSSVLERFSKDAKLSEEERASFANSASLEKEWRKARIANVKFQMMAATVLPMGIAAAAAAALPVVSVFDCQSSVVLPGTPVADPLNSPDASVKRVFQETTAVADFFKQVFGRNSLDNAGMGLLSSVHYSVKYNNAFWNGSQMTYGDGDGKIFVDFTKSNDVIAHELTHGLTQHTAGLNYTNEPGGLNESMSDVFGSMFRQWQAKQAVGAADWLIGSDIIGPDALARGYTCLRDLANPGGKHCLAPQPTKYAKYKNGMDPHESSGIPNFAFYKAAMAIGGQSWDEAGKIWYEALTAYAPRPTMKMKVFADRTRAKAGSLYPANPAIAKAVDKAWKTVGL